MLYIFFNLVRCEKSKWPPFRRIPFSQSFLSSSNTSYTVGKGENARNEQFILIYLAFRQSIFMLTKLKCICDKTQGHFACPDVWCYTYR